MGKFRDGMIGPTVILCSICLVITFALAGTYQVTLPVIEEAERVAAEDARKEVLGSADSFTQITGLELPEGVQEAYQADNGSGYVFKAGSKGFDGLVTFMVGVDAQGNYTGIKLFDHNETPGLGTKVGVKDYLEKYYGQKSPDAVDSITGATRTSTALKKTLSAVNEAYSLITGTSLDPDSITQSTKITAQDFAGTPDEDKESATNLTPGEPNKEGA